MEEEEGVGWMAMRMGDRERGSQRNDRRQARAGYPFRALARGIDGRAGLRLNLRVRMVIWIFRSWKTTEEITFCGIISSFSNALNTDS